MPNFNNKKVRPDYEVDITDCRSKPEDISEWSDSGSEIEEIEEEEEEESVAQIEAKLEDLRRQQHKFDKWKNPRETQLRSDLFSIQLKMKELKEQEARLQSELSLLGKKSRDFEQWADARKERLEAERLLAIQAVEERVAAEDEAEEEAQLNMVADCDSEDYDKEAELAKSRKETALTNNKLHQPKRNCWKEKDSLPLSKRLPSKKIEEKSKPFKGYDSQYVENPYLRKPNGYFIGRNTTSPAMQWISHSVRGVHTVGSPKEKSQRKGCCPPKTK